METIITHPLTSLTLTLSAYSAFTWLQERSGGLAALNPAVWSILLCIAFIRLSGISYETYLEGVAPIDFLLGPVTVALAIPLYRLLDILRSDAKAVLSTVSFACIMSAFSALGFAILFAASEEMRQAILTKSVTAPIAIEIANTTGTPASLAIMFVLATNIPWLLMSGVIFKAIRVSGERAQGLALGAVCHGLGTARAFQISPVAGTYAVIGMSLMGVLSGIILPFVILAIL